MNPILVSLQTYLHSVNAGQSTIAPEIIKEFADICAKKLSGRFNTKDVDREERIRMSSTGRPPCQVQAERLKMPAEQETYELPIKMMLGDLVEALLIALLKASGLNVGQGQKVSLVVAGEEISGTYDVDIDGIWDIKSASPYSFKFKFQAGIDALLEDGDIWGYLGQGFGYAEAAKKRFRGWIVCNKATGEVCLCEIPEERYEELRDRGLKLLEGGLRARNLGAFERSFTDEPEYFRRVPTGNRILGITCEYCKYKWGCWPKLKALPQLPSSGFSPPVKYYTHIDEKWLTKNEDTIG